MKFLLKYLFLLLLSATIVSCSVKPVRKAVILFTTDVHGVILPYDFIEKKEIDVSLAGVSSYVNKVREENNTVVLLDDGDNLQGQPPVYYSNFIDTVSPHINAEAMNFMGYDAATVGNHDIEAGHSVYDRLTGEYKFPLLAANAVDTRTGNPYFKPYTIIEKSGIKIAVLGMITTGVPGWLPPELYSGIEFRDLYETARKFMPEILGKRPDLVVGLFHTGWDEPGKKGEEGSHYEENGAYRIARDIEGFDIILCGHNHNTINRKIANSKGDTVLVIEGGSRAEKIGRADVLFTNDLKSGRAGKLITGKLINVDNYEPDPEFMQKFEGQKNKLLDYVNRKIAVSEATISTRDSYFGSSPFVDMIHSIQLAITGADISFAAPLSFDVSIPAGPVTVGDMFKLYRFENLLYTMKLSGAEIKKYLEFSYADWINTMKGPGDHLLKFKLDEKGKPVIRNGEAWLRNQPYNFDSAAGIDYTVDASRKEGDRIVIRSFSNGKPFEKDKIYTVAINSYRGNGGGGHLTAGAGISKDDLPKRLVRSTEKDLRFYILKDLEKKGTIRPFAYNNWQIIPEKWVSRAKSADYDLLFGK